uniref:Uncharacterized protein n=1 Tax=Rhizophora mucronata TaxID=61149 RepID=A0A2P2J300_RHIMU
MTLAKVIQHIFAQENSDRDLLRNCFNSLMEVSIRLKEVQEDMEEDDDLNEPEDDEDDDGDADSDYEDSEGDEREETEEEFLERYAKAASSLDNDSFVEEGDVDDQENEIELGSLEEGDEQGIVFSLIEKYRVALIHGQALPSQTISNFLNVFPECKIFFL